MSGAALVRVSEIGLTPPKAPLNRAKYASHTVETVCPNAAAGSVRYNRSESRSPRAMMKAPTITALRMAKSGMRTFDRQSTRPAPVMSANHRRGLLWHGSRIFFGGCRVFGGLRLITHDSLDDPAM